MNYELPQSLLFDIIYSTTYQCNGHIPYCQLKWGIVENSGAQRSILVVDDDEIIAGLIESILKNVGYQVEVAYDGETALEKTRELLPDLVVLDIMMPGISGLDVMLEMRQSPSTREIPILFITSVDDEATIVQGLRGAEDYMTKPFKAQELEIRVEKILKRTAPDPPSSRQPGTFDRLPLKIGSDTFLLPLKQIVYFEASGKYSRVYTQKRNFLADYPIGDIESRLANQGFLRIHRSYVVNLSHIMKVIQKAGKRMVVVMANEGKTQLNVSDSYCPELKMRLGMKS